MSKCRDPELDAELQALDAASCEDGRIMRDDTVNFANSIIPVYQAAIETYDQILKALQCYAERS